MKSAIAIRHIAFEDLGTLEPLLEQQGYRVEYRDAALDPLDSIHINAADLLIVLGAPIGAFDESIYPFLLDELTCIEQRLKAQQPLLGICLGAQLMARVLGASVAPMGHKEISFSSLELTAAGNASPLAAMPAATQVLHWHGDQFDIPAGTESLARTALCPHQAFAVGRHALGLQFHLEADLTKIERWLLGHCSELSHAGMDPRMLRAEAQGHAAPLKKASDAVFSRWLAECGD